MSNAMESLLSSSQRLLKTSPLFAIVVLALAGYQYLRGPGGPSESSAAGGGASGASEGVVTVGTWNLEFLGQPDRRRGLEDQPRSAADLGRIAQTLEDHHIAVVALQEINTQSDAWSTLQGELSRRGYKFIVGDPSDPQSLVIAWDSDEVKLIDGPKGPQRGKSVGAGACRTLVREPVLATFKAGEFDFTAAAVHLKADRVPDGCSDDGFPAKVRAGQVTGLMATLSTAVEEGRADPDLIVLGDLNADFNDPTLKGFGNANFRFLTAPSQRAYSSGKVSYRKGKHTGAPDHVLVGQKTLDDLVEGSPSYLPEFTELSGAEAESWRKTFSDHAPAWASFQTRRDDD